MEIKIFADGSDKNIMIDHNKNDLIKGFTTNPALLRKSGIKNYEEFALDVLTYINKKPVSFEVISDDFDEMYKQAVKIAMWGNNVNVKIPITNTKGESSKPLIDNLNWTGIKINITAITTIEQVKLVLDRLPYKRGMYISIFAGRIADTGIDPVGVINEALDLVKGTEIEIIWASTREVYNVIQAEKLGCHIITVTNDILKKLSLIGKDLTEYSLDTVKQFFTDAKEAGYTL
jgi:transaldolase